MDYFSLFLKLVFSFVAGIMFWFLEFLVMMAYAYMPGKELRSAVVLTLAPILYFILVYYLLGRFFKTEGKKGRIIDFAVLLLMTGAALGILNLFAILVV